MQTAKPAPCNIYLNMKTNTTYNYYHLEEYGQETLCIFQVF